MFKLVKSRSRGFFGTFWPEVDRRRSSYLEKDERSKMDRSHMPDEVKLIDFETGEISRDNKAGRGE